jgi:hypothetical protein
MNCPTCSVPLSMSTREGIEIDYCPKCRGVWLDRGELDKIIERSRREDDERIVIADAPAQRPAAPAAPQPPMQAPMQPPMQPPMQAQPPAYPHPAQQHPHGYPPRHVDMDDSDYGKYRYQKPRKSIWRELLDF